MAQLQLKRGATTALSGESVEDGSLIIDTQKRQLLADVGNTRIPLDGKELTQAQYNALSETERNNGTYYINDAGSMGSGFVAVDFVYATVAAMNTAISGGSVPNYATCYVTGTGGIYKVISGVATQFGGGSNPNVLLKDGSIPADNFTIGTRATESTVGTRSSVHGETCTASGTNSHAEGKSTQATAHCAHAEGLEGQATGEASHVEGGALIASGRFAHAEGNSTSATAASAHAEGASTTASGQCSHAEGYGTTTCSFYTHAEGYGTTAGNSTTPTNGQYAHAEGYQTTSTAMGSHAEGSYSDATGDHSHAEGNDTTAAAYCSHAEGSATTVYGSGSHVEGAYSYIGTATTDKISICHVEGDHSYILNASNKDVKGCHVEGYSCYIDIPNTNTSTLYGLHVEGYHTTASGDTAHAEGLKTTASGNAAHAEGFETTASGYAAHAEGYGTTASGYYSHAEGFATNAVAIDQHVGGQYNVSNSTSGNYFIIGNGSSLGRSNCFRVYTSAVYGNGAYNSSGADYAEYFEWLDSNTNAEDRAGRFVTLDGDKIRLATSEDDYILGIVSGNASVIGDSHDDQWSQMYERDIFGRFIFEDAEIPAETKEIDGEEVIIRPAHTEHRLKLNSAYDNTQTYIPRSERPEWDAVGMVGKLVALDDGTCEVNGYCAPSNGGIATKAAKSKYRVMKRIDANHIQIVIL